MATLQHLSGDRLMVASQIVNAGSLPVAHSIPEVPSLQIIAISGTHCASIAHDVSRLRALRFKGHAVRFVLAIVGKRVLRRELADTVEAIEARNNEAGREERSSGTDAPGERDWEWRSPDRLPIVLGDPFDASSARRVEEVCSRA